LSFEIVNWQLRLLIGQVYFLMNEHKNVQTESFISHCDSLLFSRMRFKDEFALSTLDNVADTHTSCRVTYLTVQESFLLIRGGD